MLAKRVQSFTWSNHGNLGDDWIGDVAKQYFPEIVPVTEQRSLNPLRLGRHVLKRDDGRPLEQQLLLWGGGWLAADRPHSRTVAAWARHLDSPDISARGVGLGIGPFTEVDAGQRQHIANIFDALNGALTVRTFADLTHVPDGCSASVGCDIALLDRRFDRFSYEGHTGDYIVLSFPAYSPHWARTRPWMTEKWYLEQVESMVHCSVARRRVVFVEFDQMLGATSDSNYWKHLATEIVKPASIEEAAGIFRRAREVFAGRLHAAILGAVVGAPTLALAYHHKFEVVSELGIPAAGLMKEPGSMPRPEVADPAVLARVRERGNDVLSLVQC